MENLNNTQTTEGQSEVTQSETQETEKTYTQAEVDEMLQRESDRRVTNALKKAEQKNAEKLREAERLANMSAEQRYEETLRQREADIRQKEIALALLENKNACSKILSDSGLSLDLVDFVVAEDADEMNANIKKLEKAFKQSVKMEVEKRLGSTKSPAATVQDIQTMTKAQFSKLKDPFVLADIKMNNPELWNELTN